MTSPRVLIVSDRLPVAVQAVEAAPAGEGGVRLVPDAGGLAAGLQSWRRGSASLWLGWLPPGASPGPQADLQRQLDEQRLAAVDLSERVAHLYHGFCQRVLWPLFHYSVDRVPVDATGWDAYRSANQAFADAVAAACCPGDTVWVHDYQLMLLPSLLRERLPGARIGFFLHVPFPSSEVFRILPWRRQLLDGILGADLIGFHTFAYMRHFLASLLHVEGVEADIDRVRLADREARLGVFPMGVDAARLTGLARDPDVERQAEAVRREAGGRRIVLGVDRLDYTKGIPRRLEAVERLLARDPALRDRIRYIQVTLPPRESDEGSQPFKRRLEEHVGRVNGAWGTVAAVPVHYLYRSVPERELAALYRAADVMLVTPLRDGMNLIAKEFAATRADGDGVLVLSEFAGAAEELDGALVVNPYDVDGVATSLARALSMPAPERRARMTALRRRVMQYDVEAWGTAFLAELASVPAGDRAGQARQPEPSLVSTVVSAARAGDIRLLVDYDGTLVPYARAPELAAPDEEVLALLASLAATPGVLVDVVSGRPREILHDWFGALPLSLWAEHGFWHRPRGGDWEPAAAPRPDWLGRIRVILEQFTALTPGSRLESKSASIAWHYRDVQREFGARQAHELRMLLGDALSNQPFEVLEGQKVIEVRLRGVSKAVVAHRVQTEAGPGTVVIAIGDDRTDEDLFRALPPDAATVAVGRRRSSARFHLNDYRAVRLILRAIVAERSPGGSERDWPQARPAPLSSLQRMRRRRLPSAG